MTPAHLILRANARGVRLSLDESGAVMASGPRPAIEGLLPILRPHREAIGQFLAESRLTAEALTAAAAVCDLHGDSDEARDDMARDVLNTPEDLLPDLIEHLKQVAQSARQGSLKETR